jgi:hypothetical protein
LNAANIVTDFFSSDNPKGPYQYGDKATLDGPLTLLGESFGFPNVSPFIG